MKKEKQKLASKEGKLEEFLKNFFSASKFLQTIFMRVKCADAITIDLKTSLSSLKQVCWIDFVVRRCCGCHWSVIRYDEVCIDPRSRVTRYVSMKNDIQRDEEWDEEGNWERRLPENGRLSAKPEFINHPNCRSANAVIYEYKPGGKCCLII